MPLHGPETATLSAIDGSVRPDQRRHRRATRLPTRCQADRQFRGNQVSRSGCTAQAVRVARRERHHHGRRQCNPCNRHQSEPAGRRCAARTDPRDGSRPVRTAAGCILIFFASPARARGCFFNGATAPAAYFSLDGGTTKLADYGQTSDASDFLNSGVQGSNDPFNEFYSGSTLRSLP